VCLRRTVTPTCSTRWPERWASPWRNSRSA
jgi:hypothetical protein